MRALFIESENDSISLRSQKQPSFGRLNFLGGMMQKLTIPPQKNMDPQFLDTFFALVF